MAYAHSFSPEFYMVEGDDELQPEDFADGREPISVYQAILAMPEDRYKDLCRELFNGHEADVDEIMAKIIETDTVGSFSSPVDVWVDDEGYFTVDVYEE